MKKRNICLVFFLSFSLASCLMAAQPFLWYKFDEGAGNVAIDSSGNGHDGTLLDVTASQWISGAPLAVDNSGDYSLDFNATGYPRCEIPLDSFSTVDKYLTISFWAKKDSTIVESYVPFMRLYGNSGCTANMFAFGYPNKSTFYWQTGTGGNLDTLALTWSSTSEYANDEWIHWVLIKDCDSGVKRIYRNGVLRHEQYGLDKPMAGIEPTHAHVGHWQGLGTFKGQIDDFRMYDQVMPLDIIQRVAGLAGDAEKPYWPEPADGETDVEFGSNTVLTWNAGDGAISHNLLIGTDPNQIPTVATDLTATEYSMNLAPFSTYYWRVDEVTADGTVEGDVWTFTTNGVSVNRDPLLWYKFDETSGTVAADSSGNDFDGEIKYPTAESQWVAGASMAIENPGSGSFRFDSPYDDTRCAIPYEVFPNLDKEISVAFWAKRDTFASVDDVNIHPILATQGGTELIISGGHSVTPWWYYWRAGASGSGNSLTWAISYSEWATGDWEHWVVTKNATIGSMKIFKNGVLRYSSDGNLYSLNNGADMGLANIGWQDGYDWGGEIDDFRIYEKELSIDAIERLAGIYDIKKAYWPYPADGETNIAFGEPVAFSWGAGEGAITHDLYVGTHPENLTLVVTGLDAAFYNYSGFEAGKTYYWRVDEVTATETVAGDVWTLETPANTMLDNFEDYADSAALNSVWVPSVAEQDYVNLDTTGFYDGSQSMRIEYENQNSPYYFEVTRTFSPAQDWTLGNIKSIGIWFHGVSTNTAQEIYVKIADGAGNNATVINPDTDAALTTDWAQWNIDLTDPAFDSVDIANIQNIVIGVGGSASTQVEPDVLYIDTIGLYPSRCIAEFSPAEDINGDCVVDFRDLQMMADSWLDCTVPGSSNCATSEEFSAAEMRNIVIDGDVSDWDNAIWYNMPLEGFAPPSDISKIDYAVSWDSTNPTVVYVAVKVNDSSHFFNDNPHGDIWNIGDLLEVRLEASGVGRDDSGWWSNQDTAQMYNVSKKETVAGAWAIWGITTITNVDNPDAEMQYAVGLDPVNSNVIVYEMALKAFTDFGGFKSTANTYKTLSAGDNIRLDLQIDGTSLMEPTQQNGAIFLNQMRDTMKPSTWYEFTLLGGVDCGSWGYVDGDVNEDCSVDMKDVGSLALEYLNEQLWP